MMPYDHNTTRLRVPYYGTEAELQELLTHVDLLAAIPHQRPMYATTDNDRPTTQRLLFHPKELSTALRKAITFRRGMRHKDLPSQLCLTESELAFLQNMALNLYASPLSKERHFEILQTLEECNVDFMDKKRKYLLDLANNHAEE